MMDDTGMRCKEWSMSQWAKTYKDISWKYHIRFLFILKMKLKKKLRDGKWHHVIVMHIPFHYKLYIDGELV